MLKRLGSLAAVLTAVVGMTNAAGAVSLEQVRARGEVLCGTHSALPGFAAPDANGRWSGFDADFCRAVAAAVLGDAERVRFVPLNSKQRFTALQSGEADMLARLTTWTATRDAGQGVDFVGINLYDGQGFLVRKSVGAKTVKDLDGATICVTLGTTTELNLADYFRNNGLKYEVVAFEQNEETARAYEEGRCDALTSDRSAVAAYRGRMADPAEHEILAEVITNEPLALAVLEGDADWADVVRWTFNAMIAAEELGITSQNVAERAKSATGEAARLLGIEGDVGASLGLAPDWAAKVISQVGNYGEVYARNIGPGTATDMERGRNELVARGGLMLSQPFR